MRAARTPPVSLSVIIESDSEEEEGPQLVHRSRARSGNPVLGARDERLKRPSQGSLPPKRPAPPVPTAGAPSAGGPEERMLAVKDIRLVTQPTALPAPQRPAPPIPTASTPSAGVPDERMPGIKDIRLVTRPTALPAPQRPAPPVPVAGKPALQTGDAVPEMQSRRERQRPEPISTPRTPVAEPDDTEEFGTPLSSPSEVVSLPSPASPTSWCSLSLSASPPTMSPHGRSMGDSPRPQAEGTPVSSPAWPSSPGDSPMPVLPPPDTKGKAKVMESPPPTPPSAKASTSAAPPEDIGESSPAQAARHPDEVAEAIELARQFELFTEEAEELLGLSVPRLPPELHQDRAVDFHDFLRDHRHLLAAKEDLLFEQDSLRELLASGQLRGIDPDRLARLDELSRADLGPRFRALRKLQADFDELLRYVKDQGGDPNWLRRRAPSMEEIEARREAERARHEQQIKAGYGF